MKKAFVIILTIFLILIDSPIGFSDKQPTDSIVVKNLMDNESIQQEKLFLTYGTTISEKQTLNDFQRMVNKLNQIFSVQLKVYTDHDDHGIIEFIGTHKKSKKTTLSIKWLGQKVQTSPNLYKTYLLVNITSQDLGTKNMKKLYDNLRNKLITLKLNPNINTTVQGAIERKLVQDEQISLINKMTKRLKGKITDKYIDKYFISSNGFSPKLNRTIKINKNKINFQISSYYHTERKRTIITIGNPIITGDS
ncbi:MAG: YwmB family TATA-box binding protein [Bacillota bacterium]|jgi:TATA-box binding|uniref:YwmB family TATA-box binding protein n=1 Tax=Fictibacillus TaxID=1329200 RepID=UPI0018CEF659|nr:MULTISPECIES: YwmB family TATA-box binding protein [unclassified Fictibacillus]MBH0157189.1 YwmB family TATA-box binding protein [Fictibacillus sp. 5RED26]MBH0159510.1 YwmB family TATA-box binding protein [Fictibacillus sp. 26RED30]MBH0163690.1 YwmB family TATA-box binding protein [Fictibacillus sp. 7GRE50]MBH0169683.1 YwmB family TATA-box binding protein [Fictibacillus sp. 18YEL24]MBH0174183.1 YwmB family TATA-box binding protein [Fictibacillus sp. 23RED33]